MSFKSYASRQVSGEVRVRLTGDTYTLLKKYAKRLGVPVAQYARHILITEINKLESGSISGYISDRVGKEYIGYEPSDKETAEDLLELDRFIRTFERIRNRARLFDRIKNRKKLF